MRLINRLLPPLSKIFFRIVILQLVLSFPAFSKNYIKSIHWSGLEQREIKELEGLLYNQPPTLIRKLFKKYPLYVESFMPIDRRLISDYLRDRGYYFTQVTDSVEKNGNLLNIYYYIDKGVLIWLDSLSIAGSNFFDSYELKKGMSSQTGRPLSIGKLKADSLNVLKKLNDQGFLDARVRIEWHETDTQKVALEFQLEENRRYRISNISLLGFQKVAPWLLKRELRFKNGEYFNYKKVEQSRDYLFESGLFSYVSILPYKNGDSSMVDLVVKINENKTYGISLHLGFEQYEQQSSVISLDGEYQIRNLFNNGWLVTFSPNVGINIKNPLIYQTYAFRIVFVERWLLGFRIPFTISPYFQYKKTNLYQFKETGLQLEIRHRLKQNNWLLNRLLVGKKEFYGEITSEIKDQVGNGWYNGVQTLFEIDTRDNIFLPVKGYYFTLQQFVFGGILGGENNYYKLVGSWNRYYRQLNYRLKLGFATSLDNTRPFPIEEGFWGGGSNSWRGFAEQSIGYYNPDVGKVIGGQIQLLFNLNIDIWQWSFIKQIIFIDCGNIWHNYKSIYLKSLATGIGSGIHFITPIGPVRFEFGYNIDRPFAFSAFRFHFAIMPMF